METTKIINTENKLGREGDDVEPDVPQPAVPEADGRAGGPPGL